MNAPIVMFVYARPEHTRKTLAALASNRLADESELIIFSDGPKGKEDQTLVDEVRRTIKAIIGFSKITVHEREQNYGLASNIISGLTHVFQTSKTAIILEDDIECAPGFLTYMNEALRTYESNAKIWHINGWSYPLTERMLPSVYCTRIMNCWGWATWKDRWSMLNLNAEYYIGEWSIRTKFQFNANGTYPFYSQIIANYLNKKNTWAIFWYATIFDAHGLCVTPSTTLTNELGSDGSGTHKLDSDMYLAKLSQNKEWDFKQMPIEECAAASAAIANFNKEHFGIFNRVINIIKILLPISALRPLRVPDRGGLQSHAITTSRSSEAVGPRPTISSLSRNRKPPT